MGLMLRLVVLISGQGSNLQALIDASQDPTWGARIVGVLSNRAQAFGLQRAHQAGLDTAVITAADYPDRDVYDRQMMAQIDAWQADLVVLAGFMRILGEEFVAHFADRLLNIHPSLLPRHKGLDTHARVLAAHDSEHGCSVHWVHAELDAGPLIAQACFDVQSDDDVASLTTKVHHLEHRLYPLVIQQIATACRHQENPHALPFHRYRLSADGRLEPS